MFESEWASIKENALPSLAFTGILILWQLARILGRLERIHSELSAIRRGPR